MALFLRLVLLAVFLCLIGGGIGLAYLDKVAGATACFTVSTLVLIFVYLSQFKRFKGLGIEAEMWEREMEEAQEIAEKFRGLAVVVAKPLIANGMRLGRWDGYLTRREIDEMVTQVGGILKNAGSKPEEIREALHDYRIYTAFDMAQPAHTYVKAMLDAVVARRKQPVEVMKGMSPPGQSEAFQEAVASLRASEEEAARVLKVFDPAFADRYPDIIIERINQCPILDAEAKTRLLEKIKDTLDDLAHFRDTGKIRRPDVWFNEPTQ